MSLKISRVALVTGGMGGLGEAICIKLAALGYKVVTTYSPGNTKAKEWLDGMNKMGYGFRAYPCDVADFDSCAACVRAGGEGSRPDRRAGQQRRHHARHDVQEDGPSVNWDAVMQDQSRLLLQHDQAGVRRHGRSRLGPDHQHLVGQRPEGRVRPDQLLGRQGRHARLHQGARARSRAQGRDGEHDLARLHRHEDGDGDPEGGARHQDHPADPDGTARQARGSRGARRLSVRARKPPS